MAPECGIHTFLFNEFIVRTILNNFSTFETERFIHHSDFARNIFELCIINTTQ